MKICLRRADKTTGTVQTSEYPITHGVVDGGPVDFLLGVLLLLQFEYVLVEVKVEVLVGVIYAELLEAVLREVLEAEYVQDGDGGGLLGALVHDVIDAGDQPGEQRAVERLGERVPGVQRLIDIQGR